MSLRSLAICVLLHPLTLWAADLERPRRHSSIGPTVTYDRVDVWVLKVCIAIPVVLLTLVAAIHLSGYLTRNLKKRRVARISPEPPERRPTTPVKQPGSQSP
jgi:hypothetical protein